MFLNIEIGLLRNEEGLMDTDMRGYMAVEFMIALRNVT